MSVQLFVTDCQGRYLNVVVPKENLDVLHRRTGVFRAMSGIISSDIRQTDFFEVEMMDQTLHPLERPQFKGVPRENAQRSLSGRLGRASVSLPHVHVCGVLHDMNGTELPEMASRNT